jgi:hypothetical protein
MHLTWFTKMMQIIRSIPYFELNTPLLDCP